ncbi:MAG TPA: hypothetical protein VG433_13095 [Pirellulales bacterium]|nr:hypothetical protein [Pirellulales bacterium]
MHRAFRIQCRGLLIAGALCSLAISAARHLSADDAPAAAGGNAAIDLEPFQQLVRQIILDELKPQYEDRKHWGQKGKVLTGVKVKGKWFDPYLEKRTKEVNDGLWQRYVVTLIEPEKNLEVRLDHARGVDANHVAFSVTLRSKLSGEAHIERWRKGVKMLNTSALGDMIVEARIDCDVNTRLVPGKLLSDVVLEPRITGVKLQLVDLDLRKVGVLGHDIAHELGDSLTPMLSRELQEREPKIVRKANAAIDKRRDRLRFSLDKFLASGWSKLQSTLAQPSDAKPAAQ